jgi:hypothetical protein
MRAVEYRIGWRPGTRAASTFAVDLVPWNGTTRTVELEPLYDFQMMGVGYTHPDWGHGVWKGELEVASDRWDLPVADPCAPHHVHIQTVCRATCGDDEGVGVLEQFVIGDHEPTGLTGAFAGAAH